MGITSLSHIGVVLAVVAVFVVMWKLKQRRPRGAAYAAAPAQAQSIPWTFFKGFALAVLFSGSMLPMFRTDGFAPVIHMVSTIGLTLLAALWLFRKPSR